MGTFILSTIFHATFSLIKLGVPDSKLRITYVSYSKANSNYDQAHMVLSYYHKTGAEPVILDNINKTLQPASKRTDSLSFLVR